VQFLNWRWIFWIQLILYGALFPLFAYFIEETRHHIILRRLAKKARKETGRNLKTQAEIDDVKLHSFMYESVTRPGKLLFTEPVLMCCTLWSAFAFGTVFFFTQSVEQVFEELYGWSEYQCGYVQGAVVIGEILGWVASLYGSRLFLKSAKRNTEFPGRPIPEARLYVSVFGSFVGISGGMFVYAWTSYPYIHWSAPAVGLGMVGFGIQIVVSAVADYVTDAYADSGKNGSAISAVAAGEDVVAGLLPLATQSMYNTLGFNWASTLLALIALVISFAPVVFILKGRQLREKSPFMNSASGNVVGQNSEETKSGRSYSNDVSV
jgi:MFS family permease